MKETSLTVYGARKIAKQFSVKLPRVGYEISLGNGNWLSSTGHFQFGWFESKASHPYVLKEKE